MTLFVFPLIFGAGVLSLVAVPVMIQLSRKWRLIDTPGTAPHKQHTRPIPLAGGGALFITIFIMGWPGGFFQDPQMRGIFGSALIVFLFGLWDDLKGLDATRKLLGQSLAVIFLIYGGTYVQLFPVPYINWVITYLWVVGITNAYNFVDSMDGLAIGLAGIAAAFFMLVTYDAGQLPISALSAALLGACAGVYLYNISPANIFIGDSGAQWLGFVLASIGIAYNPVDFLPTQSWFIPILLVGMPLFDMLLVVYSRLRHGRPVYQAGLDHTYHRLHALGLAPNRAVALMHLTALFLGCLAFITLAVHPLWANLIYLACLAAGSGVIYYFDHKHGLAANTRDQPPR